MFECPICYRHRRKIVTLQCQHRVCYFCWLKWSEKELDFYGKRWPTCPSCRAPQLPWYMRERVQYGIVFAAFVLLYLNASGKLAALIEID
ncbi:RING finger protein [bacterium]|nr:RING finger protein [bacterium]